MKNFIQKGEAIDYTVPTGETVNSGDIVVVGDMAAVAITSGDEGETIALAAEGVYSLPKVTGVIAQGTKVYVKEDADDGNLISVESTGNVFIGYAWSSAAAADSTVDVKLF